MENQLNATDIKQQVSLVVLLDRLGYQPARKSGKELLYLSMLRDSDTKPSLAVNEELNVWFDHGAGKGGNIVDFGLAYWPGYEFGEVLMKIKQTSQQEIVPSRFMERTSRRRHAVKIPNYQVEEIKELGNNPAITFYLQSRGIWDEAQGRLKEIYYYVEDEKKLRKHFFAAGWQNEFGTWEVRNKYFKGCLGHKAVTLIRNSDCHLSVFEGYLDYLSWLHEFPESNSSILILNTLSLLQAGIVHAKDFVSIDLFFDRDKAGLEASNKFIAASPVAVDQSAYYDGFEDYNDKIKSLVSISQDFAVTGSTYTTFSR